MTQEKIAFNLFKERCDDADLDELVILFDNYIDFQAVFDAVGSECSLNKNLRYIKRSIKKLDPDFFK